MNCGFFPRPCVRVCELLSPFRSQKPSLLTWEGSALQRAGQVSRGRGSKALGTILPFDREIRRAGGDRSRRKAGSPPRVRPQLAYSRVHHGASEAWGPIAHACAPPPTTPRCSAQKHVPPEPPVFFPRILPNEFMFWLANASLLLIYGAFNSTGSSS